MWKWTSRPDSRSFLTKKILPSGEDGLEGIGDQGPNAGTIADLWIKILKQLWKQIWTTFRRSVEEENNDDAVDEEAEVPSALSADAVILNSSLDGIEDAGHHDWVEAVKSAKTLSRMSTLVTSFIKRAKTTPSC